MEATLHYIADPGQQELRDFDVLVEDLIDRFLEDLRALREQAEQVDPAHVERFAETARKLSKRLNEELPPVLEPEAVAEARGLVLEALHELDEVDESQPWDSVEIFVLKAEAIRHLVRDALDAHIGSDGQDLRALTKTLEEWLPRVTQKELARLLDISPRQLQRWRADGGAPTRRVLLVAQLMALLRRAWTPEGVVAWFDRPRRDLGGKPPLELLDDPEFEGALLTAARQGRAQHGS